MTSLRQALDSYLRIRRGLGFKLVSDQSLLESFVGFLEQAGVQRITSEPALMWARTPDAHPHRWSQRLGIVRVFARYVATLDPESEVVETVDDHPDDANGVQAAVRGHRRIWAFRTGYKPARALARRSQTPDQGDGTLSRRDQLPHPRLAVFVLFQLHLQQRPPSPTSTA